MKKHIGKRYGNLNSRKMRNRGTYEKDEGNSAIEGKKTRDERIWKNPEDDRE